MVRVKNRKKRVVSGIQPTADSHIGNYIGAMRQWPKLQTEGTESFYFVADLHALSGLRDPEVLRSNTLNIVAWLMAVGVDPQKSTIFIQSQIPAHAELNWILNNFVTMGELSRMTQYKEKSKRLGADGQVAGLFNYPTLMAADVILYDADEVPVGEDQVQHLELARKIAARFNNKIGKLFKLPKPIIQDVGAKVMDLQEPTRKMDKSNPNKAGVVLLSDPTKLIKEKILKAVTDSGKGISYDPDKRAAVSNLLHIYSAFSGKDIPALVSKYRNTGFAEFKEDLADVVISRIVKLQERHKELVSDEDKLLSILEAGKAKAEAIANRKLEEVKHKLGLV